MTYFFFYLSIYFKHSMTDPWGNSFVIPGPSIKLIVSVGASH